MKRTSNSGDTVFPKCLKVKLQENPKRIKLFLALVIIIINKKVIKKNLFGCSKIESFSLKSSSPQHKKKNQPSRS